MNCTEFLRQFREALDGKVSEHIIQDNVNYYSSYIKGQIGNGKSESEVLSTLGDPRLLAKTIEESNKFAGESRTQQSQAFNYRTNSSQTGRNYTREDESIKGKQIRLPGWLIAGIVLAVLVFVMIVAFRVFVFFMPLIAAAMVVGFVYKVVRDWMSG